MVCSATTVAAFVALESALIRPVGHLLPSCFALLRRTGEGDNSKILCPLPARLASSYPTMGKAQQFRAGLPKLAPNQ